MYRLVCVLGLIASTATAAADEAPAPASPGSAELELRRVVLEEKVLFDTSRARVKSRAFKLLDTLVDAWSIQPEWDRIVIEGHTDSRGDDDFNHWLGLERASRARAALIARGAPADRIEIVSYGSTRPRSRTRGDTAQARNRRVEFVIMRRAAPVVSARAARAGQSLDASPR